MGQLSLLHRHLQRLETTQSSTADDAEIKAATDFFDDDATSTASAPTSVSLSTITSGDEESDEDEPSTPAAVEEQQPSPWAGIMHANHRLHRVGIAIRKAGATSHDLKASKEQFMNEDGVNVVDAHRKWCLDLLHYNFKTADRNLLERLAQANAERRRIFLYRKQHEMKLKGRRDSAQRPTNPTAPTIRPFSASRVQSFTDVNLAMARNAEMKSTAQGSTAQMTKTTASAFNRNAWHYEPSMQSTVFTAAPSTQRLVDSSIWPPAPKVPAGAAEFVCPYCSKVHPAAERSGKRWRTHFLRDLAPYVCIIEDCHDPYVLFSDHSKWKEHMESHNVRYTCRQHPKPIKFPSAAEFDRHILQAHRQLPPAQLVRLRSISDSRSRLDICSCPLCGFVPTKAPFPGKSVANHDAAYKELLDHIANDLHFVAMWSIDEIEDLNESIPSNPSELRVADQSTVATDISPVDEFDPPPLGDGDTRFSEESLVTIEDNEPVEQIPDGADVTEQWSFVQRRTSMSDGEVQADPKLDSFVRKFQLERLLEEGKAADPQLPYYQIPADPGEQFYGREDALRILESALHPSRAAKELRTMTLTGPAGIGKTALAARYCHHFQNQYDVVFWVHADQDAKLANDFAEIAIGLGFVAKDSIESRDHDHCRQLVRAWLANPLKHREQSGDSEKATWLLVLDHIIDSNAADNYWPTDSKSGSILITSRKAMPWRSTFFPVCELKPFNASESAAFLFEQIKTKDLDGQSIRLGSRAVYTPTQLVFLAKAIASKKYSLERFSQASQDDSGKKTILLLHKEDATQNQADFADWALESITPQAGALLNAIAMLDPDQIAEELLTDPPDSVSIPEYPRTTAEYTQARAELSEITFIARNRPLKTLSIHRVVQDAARRNMSPQQYRVVFNSCVALINEEWPYQEFTWRHGTDRWALCDNLYPHIVRLMGFSRRIDISEEELDADYGFARLATDVAWFCHERGRSSVGVEFCQTALSICLKLIELLEQDPRLSKIITVGRLNTTIAEIHHNHGCIIAEMNKPAEALGHQLIFNRMMLQELGKQPGKDMRLAMSFNELGVAYMINNDFNKGQECFQRAADEMRRLEDFEEWKISLPQVNLAYCYYFDKRFADAEDILLKGLAERVAKFGENDQESFITGRFYNGLALVKLGQGQEESSYQYLKKAMDHYKSTVGRGHHRSADVSVAIGQHHCRVNEFRAAM